LPPCADLVPAPDEQGPTFASQRSVKTEGFERRFERRRVPSTGCQQPGDNPAHGHVSSSSMEGTSGAADPAPLRGGTGEAALGRSSTVGDARPRKRACVEGEGQRPAGSARAGPARWDRRGVRPACRTCWAGSRWRRALQPASPRSHDRRCPSGSGWGEAPRRAPSGAHVGGVVRRRRRHPPSPGRPLTREPLAGVAYPPEDAGSLLAGGRDSKATSGKGPQGPDPEVVSAASPGEAKKRATSDAPAGDREIGGCARGLFWLQKSTSGARS